MNSIIVSGKKLLSDVYRYLFEEEKATDTFHDWKIFTVNGTKVELDESGYMKNYNDWNPEIAEIMAKREGVELTDKHWEVINPIREYLINNESALDYRDLYEIMEKKIGEGKETNVYLMSLFPAGFVDEYPGYYEYDYVLATGAKIAKLSGLCRQHAKFLVRALKTPPLPFIVVNGKYIEVDDKGRLEDLSDWSPEVAEYMAKEDRIILTDEHWKVINPIREYFIKNESPLNYRTLHNYVERNFGKVNEAKDYLMPLFPANQFVLSSGEQMSRLSGLPQPSGYIITLSGKDVCIDIIGGLEDRSDWTPEVVEYMAQEDGIILTDEHWKIINLYRRFYDEWQFIPAQQVMLKFLVGEGNPEIAVMKCLLQDSYLTSLFPLDPEEIRCDGRYGRAYRYAGIPIATGH